MKNKKVFYAIKRPDKDGFFAGYDAEGLEVFQEKRYWLYDFKVAIKKHLTMQNYPRLEVVESPVQDERAAWGPEAVWRG